MKYAMKWNNIFNELNIENFSEMFINHTRPSSSWQAQITIEEK